MPGGRVVWAEENLRGIGGWGAKVLGAGGLQKRGLVGDAQVVVADVAVEVREEVSRRMEVLKKVWGLDGKGTEEGDSWALSGGRCGRGW